jgi:restriction endonuclease S subunit
MKNISKDQLLDMSLTLPPLAQQQRIADELTAWNHAADNLRSQAKRFVAEHGALMQHLLTEFHDIRQLNEKTA